VYGWVNVGFDFSTSNKSNIPESYAIVPNKLELDQGVVRIERLPDTVQRDHVDWGFRLTPMYGIDYRWTTAQGWFSGQLLNHNRLYGFDPVEANGLVYVPNAAQGMVIKFGRYISPPDDTVTSRRLTCPAGSKAIPACCFASTALFCLMAVALRFTPRLLSSTTHLQARRSMSRVRSNQEAAAAKPSSTQRSELVALCCAEFSEEARGPESDRS
jgi:hypothetical protein